ncbi:MAG: GAF domain-containing sensor histidine kinase [Magnetococcales bacterium]|nr:GAF domain-containing sensor histidine kinase [Magnetococcales bacterium]
MSTLYFSRLKNSPWPFFLFLLLVLIGIVLFNIHRFNLHQQDFFKKQSQTELDLIHTVVTEDLIQGNYQAIGDFLKEWAKGVENVQEVRVTSKNGFVLGSYSNPKTDSKTKTFEKNLSYSYSGQATITLIKSTRQSRVEFYSIFLEYTVSALLILSLFLYVIHQSNHRRREANKLLIQKEKLDFANQSLQAEIFQRKQAEESSRRDQQSKTAVAALLQATISSYTMDALLEEALRIILSIPWLSVQNKGAIFLFDQESDRLIMMAMEGIPKPILTLCSEISKDHCLCGLAAKEERIIFTSSMDARHTVHYDGLEDHGHYCVPFMFGNELYGVISLYVDAEHSQQPEEVEFLQIIANTLAAVVVHKQMEEEASKLNMELERRVFQRTQELYQSIEQLKQTQSQLIESEKLASLGELVAGVAHEINTPVGIGITASSYLEKEVKKCLNNLTGNTLKRSELQQFLAVVEESASLIHINLNRAAHLIRSFKQVAIDRSSEELRVFDMKIYLDEVMSSLKPKFKRTGHRVTIECPEKLMVKSFPSVIAQIVTNLVFNSLIHGFETVKNGQITLLVTDHEERIAFEYSDNGIGMSAEQLNQIYNPFFTTKRNQGGSGLGMHIVYNLVTQTLDGTIRCQSRPGEGCRFYFSMSKTRSASEK